jgi:hypothetical protein
MGGPHVTSSQVERLLDGLRIGMTRSAACASAGFSRMTLYRMLADATFVTEVEKAEGEAKGIYESKIAQAADAGTWQAAAWWLERRHPDEYSRRDRVEVTFDLRKFAEERGLDPDEVMAEADAILSARNARG